MELKSQSSASPTQIDLIVQARHHDPFSVLGRHQTTYGDDIIRVFIPQAVHVAIEIPGSSLAMRKIDDGGLFEWRGTPSLTPTRYVLLWQDGVGNSMRNYDPYSFPPQLTDYDLHLFGEGRHRHAYRFMGAHPCAVDGIDGVAFAVWAPNAERVSVVGEFNQWDGRRHSMRVRGASGVWELFIPGLKPGIIYKFEIRGRDSVIPHLKADPYAQRGELRPNTASIVPADESFAWTDADWMRERDTSSWQHRPLSIYEVHLGSWQRDADGGFLDYRELARRLVPYVISLGFTHIELLPVMEHPYDPSWGYQVTGYYAATSRHGSPDDLRWFIDHCHAHGIGVILDWVPGHFPRDAHGLARFDGRTLYEHEDPRSGEHPDWGTLIFNYGRNEVKNFLVSNAVFWLDEFHVDGLRVDGVASMLYLDYSRAEGEWIPNKYGGRENLEAIAFLRELNTITHEQFPGTLTIAEESTSWPMVSRPVWVGGLGFSMKWNMGWMHDTLQYISKDPLYRHYHHHQLSFSLLYAFTENFVLPFSHDEVVHGKGSLRCKVPGDNWQQFANLRLLYTYMFTQPGKKLLFMGCEFAQGPEWNCNQPLDWYVLEYPEHKDVQSLVGDLNRLYRDSIALHYYDFEERGFEWIDCHDADRSILSFVRKSDDETLIVVLNFTPTPHTAYRLGAPQSGTYQELFNSDSEYYGGGNLGNGMALHTENVPWMGRPHSFLLAVPPLAGVILRRV